MDDLNDVRATLGAVHNSMKHLVDAVEKLNDKVDDYGALAARAAQMSDLIEALERMVNEVPGGLRQAAADPTFGMFIGEPLRELADDIENGLREWRSRRASAPRIERD